MQITFLTRKCPSVRFDLYVQRVSSLTLDGNGVFAIKAYGRVQDDCYVYIHFIMVEHIITRPLCCDYYAKPEGVLPICRLLLVITNQDRGGRVEDVTIFVRSDQNGQDQERVRQRDCTGGTVWREHEKQD